jgi:hypothetical protein
MRKTVLFLIAALLMAVIVRAQVDIRFGPALGLLGYRIPSVDTVFHNETPIRVSVQKPTFGFSLGCNGRMQLKQHWHAISGIEYQYFGESLREKYIAIGHHTGPYNVDVFIRRTLHKLALPVMMGYNFGSGKFRPTLALGVRTGLILKHNDHFDYFEPQPDFWNATGPITYSRDDDRIAGVFVDRWTLQLIGSLGAEIGTDWYLGLHFAAGRPKYLPFYYGGDAHLPNYDLSLQVIFRPFQVCGKPRP